MFLIPKRWIIGGVVAAWVAVLTFEHEGDASSNAPEQSQVQRLVPCVVRVEADGLNVRSGPGLDQPVVGHLEQGAILPAARTPEDSFRQLGPGRWIGRWTSDDFLDPLPGADCD